MSYGPRQKLESLRPALAFPLSLLDDAVFDSLVIVVGVSVVGVSDVARKYPRKLPVGRSSNLVT
jgi:hypothetical protein